MKLFASMTKKMVNNNIEFGQELCSGIYPYNEVPGFLQGNCWIQRGYRVNFTYSQCLKSILMWTNESLNIWTHLIGAIWFLLLIVYDNTVPIPQLGGGLRDHLVVTTFEFCFVMCLVLSAGYHTFCCHSALSHQKWLALDLAGISMSLIGIYVSSFFYGFYCHPRLQYFYTGVVTLFLVVNTFLHTKPEFLSRKWSLRRTVLYCCLVLFGVIPASHWYILLGGWSNPVVKMFLPKLVIMYLLGFLGVSLYATKLPERLMPGWFDYVGCSHQWWHIIVFCAFLWWHNAAFTLVQYRVKGNCQNG